MSTKLLHLLAWLFGAVFFTNAVPHFVAGVSGSPFQSPFATPPGQGLSSSTLNVVWGVTNLVIAWALLRVGSLELKKPVHFAPILVGTLLMGLFLARHFGPLHGGAL
ncbi:MAG: hypothetical protein ACO1OB_25115 [Archangium sp.]